MKNQTLIVASLCMMVALAVPAHAQAGGVQVRVPFDFTVSEKTFQAGQYTMVEAPLGVSIQDEHGVTIAMVLATNVTGRSVGEKGQITFHCYNERRCFLSEVWLPTRVSGRELLISGPESDLAKEASQKEVALLGQTRE